MEIALIFMEFARFSFKLSIMPTQLVCGRFKKPYPVLANHSW
jgi:hypothetical protein